MHSGEFAGVIGDERQLQAERMGSNHRIERADGQSASFQARPQLSITLSSICIEGFDFQRREEQVQCGMVLYWFSGTLSFDVLELVSKKTKDLRLFFL